MHGTPAELAVPVLERTLGRPPTLGSTRLVCLDGLAGSGKSSLGRALADARDDVHLVETDHLMEGWDGLPGLPATLAAVLGPLAEDQPGRWRRWDWVADQWAEWHEVVPGGLLVLDGVGSAAARYAELVTTLVWVEAPEALRLERGLARDGAAMADHWHTWLGVEAEHHAREHTRERADLLVATG